METNGPKLMLAARPYRIPKLFIGAQVILLLCAAGRDQNRFSPFMRFLCAGCSPPLCAILLTVTLTEGVREGERKAVQRRKVPRHNLRSTFLENRVQFIEMYRIQYGYDSKISILFYCSVDLSNKQKN